MARYKIKLTVGNTADEETIKDIILGRGRITSTAIVFDAIISVPAEHLRAHQQFIHGELPTNMDDLRSYNAWKLRSWGTLSTNAENFNRNDKYTMSFETCEGFALPIIKKLSAMFPKVMFTVHAVGDTVQTVVFLGGVISYKQEEVAETKAAIVNFVNGDVSEADYFLFLHNKH
jgi:hypothetical protein